MENRYLRDRARNRDMARGRRGRDYYHSGNDYRSRGGRNDRHYSEYDYAEYDSRNDYGYNADRRTSDYRMDDEHYRQPRRYEMYGLRGDYNDYDYQDYASEDEEYKKDLKEWTKKLKSKDKFGVQEKELIDKAKQMGVKFQDYSEEEFLATYYMLMSDYTHVGNDLHMYLIMAKEFLEDKDIAVSPSEKRCIYLYEIVKGE